MMPRCFPLTNEIWQPSTSSASMFSLQANPIPTLKVFLARESGAAKNPLNSRVPVKTIHPVSNDSGGL
jgi:hypothetical protein